MLRLSTIPIKDETRGTDSMIAYQLGMDTKPIILCHLVKRGHLIGVMICRLVKQEKARSPRRIEGLAMSYGTISQNPMLHVTKA